jgi:hypothetical protein
MKNRRMRWIIGLSAGVLVIALFVLAGSMVWDYHEKPQFCATCHIMQPYLDGWTGTTLDENGNELLAAHHQEADIACLDCHPADLGQQVSELTAYIKGDFSDPLKPRKFPDEFCTTCHSDDALRIAETENYVVTWELAPVFAGMLLTASDQSWTNVNSMTINPHTISVDITNSSDPHHAGGPAITCSSCHKSHEESLLVNYCYTCHHTESLVPCAVCHTE